MAIVWKSPALQAQDEDRDGPSLYYEAYDTVDDNYSTKYILIDGAGVYKQDVTTDANGDTRYGGIYLDESLLVNYRGYETPIAGNNFTVTIKAAHQWFDWNTNSWVVTEGTQGHTIQIRDVAAQVPHTSGYGESYEKPLIGLMGVNEGAAAGTVIPNNYNFYEWTETQFTDYSGPSTMTLLDDADGRFYLEKSGTTYVLKVADGSRIDYDAVQGGDLTGYKLTIGVNDGTTITKGYAYVSINNMLPTSAAEGSAEVAEHSANGTTVGFAPVATDPGGGEITYRFTEGDGRKTFSPSALGLTIDASTGAIKVSQAALLSLENVAARTGDASGKIAFDVVASDAQGAEAYSTFLLTVTEGKKANAAPAITGAANVLVKSNENATLATTIKASDADGDKLSFSISGGPDADRFKLDMSGDTAKLVFKSAPDFEKPTDVGKNNVYNVIVRADDRKGGVDDQAIAVQIKNVAGKTFNGTKSANSYAGAGEEDTFRGKGGIDTLKGLGGADTFVFDTQPDTNKNFDKITDFSSVDDTIEIDNKFFVGLKTGKLAASLFQDLSKGKADDKDRIIYDKAKGDLYFDQDGSKDGHERIKFAEVKDKTFIDHTDSFVI